MDLGLGGKKALVTGATRGIGRAIAEALADEGADVAICARTADTLDEAVETLKGKGARAFGRRCDVGDAAAYRAFIQAAAADLGGLDILVQNTSGGGGADEAGWERNFKVDLMGAVRGVEVATPYLEKSGQGSIVFIGSTSAIESSGEPGPYAPFKAALLAYTNSLGQALGPKGIRVNTVSPGSIYFEGGVWAQIEKSRPEFYQRVIRRIPFGRCGAPEEVARAVAFIVSPAASWITGTQIIVDGGQHKGLDA
jgi:3-oxoacyl-[acyl-carrier protein] reductase